MEVDASKMSGNIGEWSITEETEKDNSLQKAIYKLAASVPSQTKVNLDAKYKFERENDELLKAFFDLGVALTDENGEYRSTIDVLNDLSEKWKDIKT